MAFAVVTDLTMYAAGHVQRRISFKGAMLLDRVAGILLTAIAVILLANGFTERNLYRRVTAVLPSHLAAMALAVRSDVVCLVPATLPGDPASPLTHTATDLGLPLLDIPLSLPPLTIGMAWHPRQAADGAHRWLRDAVRRTLHAPEAI